MAETSPSARERILATAMRLFYQDGIRATGIDRIIAESGVAKMSFYRNFPSKKDLVVAFLHRRHEAWMAWFTGRVEELRQKKGANLLALALALEEWFSEPTFRGCAFINTVAEAGDETERAIAAEHKRELRDYIKSMIPDIPPGRAEHLADLSLLIIDGAIVRAQMTGDPTVADQALALFRLLDSAASPSTDNAPPISSVP